MNNIVTRMCHWTNRFTHVLAVIISVVVAPLAVGADLVELYNGTSRFDIPIETPSGTNGVGPSLSLTYGSGGGNGWLGDGWNLTGLGSIERLGPTYSPSPTYTAIDTYRLNLGGIANLVYAGVDPAGVAGNYYRTQIESFQRIEYVSASNYWIVTDKSGTKYFFGESAASQQNNPGNVAQVFSWKLDKVQDTHGVYWTVSYDKDAVNGDMYPKQIVYSQGAGLSCTQSNLTACRTVDFTLRTRVPDALPISYPRDGMDTPFSYRSGARIVSDKLLARIDVKLGGQLVHTYDTDHYNFEGNSPDGAVGSYYTDGVGPRATTRVTKLMQIVELGADGLLYRPNYYFTYHRNPYDSTTNPTATTLIQVGMTGDPVESLGGPQANPATASNCTYSIDMNNDGRSDVLVGQASNWYYYPSLGNGSFGAKTNISSPAIALPSLCTSTTTYQRYQSGWHEVTFPGTMGQYKYDTPNAISFEIDDWAPVPNDWDLVWGWITSYQPTMSSREIVQPVRDTIVMDMDGDGLPDVLYSSGVGAWYWWKGLTNAQFANQAVINSGATAPPVSLSDKDVRLVDMDSDGLPDLVKMILISGTCAHAPSTWRIDVYRNLGPDASGVLRFSATAKSSPNVDIDVNDPDATPVSCAGVPAMPSNGFAFVDMNGDGMSDLTWFVRGLTSTLYPQGVRRVHYYPNQGSPGGTAWSFAPKAAVAGDMQIGYAIMAQVDRWADMNGDGMPDLLAGVGTNTTGGYYYYYPLTASHLYANGSFGGGVALQNSPTVDLTRDNFMSLADLNGNGVPGILQGKAGNYVYYSLDHSSNHHNLETVLNPLGGQTTLSYNKLLSGNTNRWVTNQVGLDDGLGSVTTWNYSYSGGKYVGWPNNEFRGYSQVVVVDPAGHNETTYFHQDDIKKGRVNYTQKFRVASEGGGLMTQTTNTYATSTPIAGVARVDLTAEQTDTYDGGSSFKTARTDYTAFDAYGTARTLLTSGTGITTRATTTDFAYNTSDYILNRPSHTVGQIGSVTGTKINEAWFDYDNLANAVAPTKGDVTRETHWLSTGTSPVTQYVYDAVGNRTGNIDPRVKVCSITNLTTSISYDATYQTYPITETNALCQITSRSYWGINTTIDAAAAFAYPFPGALATVTDANAVRSDSYWTGDGRLYKSVIPPDTMDAPTKQMGYSVYSVPNEIIEYTGPNKYTFIDGFGRTVQVKTKSTVTGKKITQDTWYNNRGLIESVTIPYITLSSAFTARDTSQYKTTTLYDAVNRPTRITNPDSTYHTMTYTPYVVASTDENFYTTTRTYDAMNRLISVVEPSDGGTTSYSYDTFTTNGKNNQIIVNNQGDRTTTTFNTLGRKVALNDPDLGGNWVYGYDANGNLVNQTDAKAQKITYTYDNLNRVKTKTYPNSGGVIKYLYDNITAGTYRIGHLWKVTDLTGSTVFTFDQRGRQSKVAKTIGLNTYTTQYTYDWLDRPVTMTYPGGERISYLYTDQGPVYSASSTLGTYVTGLDYDAFGNITSKTFGNDKVTTNSYYATNGRLYSITTPGLQSFGYSYDNVGNVQYVTDNLKPTIQNFGYDSLNRLTSASDAVAPAFTHSYSYDPIGNMKTGAGKTFTYPPATTAHPHAPSSDGTCSYHYDANGNADSRTCGASVRTFTWDYDNRLSQVNDGITVLETSSYDYAGQRVQKVEGANTILTPFPHYRVVNGAVTKYYFANGQRVAERDSAGNVFYYHADHLGSSNKVSDSTGAEVKSTQFYPYGATRSESGIKAIAHKYTGQEADDSTGLYYYGARYYDTNLMHFISADSIIPNMADPQALNRYAYVSGNPMNAVDPSGHSGVLMALYINRQSVGSALFKLNPGVDSDLERALIDHYFFNGGSNFHMSTDQWANYQSAVSSGNNAYYNQGVGSVPTSPPANGSIDSYDFDPFYGTWRTPENNALNMAGYILGPMLGGYNFDIYPPASNDNFVSYPPASNDNFDWLGGLEWLF